MPKVAIITRTKNRPLFLKRALESVKRQSYKDYIHVIVNDGGDLKEVNAILKDFGYKSIKLIHNEESVGHTKALNKGIRAVATEYIAILDDDDTWDPDYLKFTVEHLENTQAKGVVTVLDRIVEKLEKGTITTELQERWRPDITAVSLYGQCIDNYAPTVAFVYRRDVYEELGGYDESLGVSEDWEFALRFLLKYDIDFLNTEKALAFYHHRPDATGSVGNSVFFGVDQHRYHMNMLANRLLRQDIKQGKMGVGYIINSLRYHRDFIVPREVERQLQQTVRLEGHTNYTAAQLEETIVAKVRNEMNTAISSYHMQVSPYMKIRKYLGRIRRAVTGGGK